jgi:hypothetical protein
MEQHYSEMENYTYWQKNFTPNYALTKQESKEFTSLSKVLDEESTRITSINLSATARRKSQVISNIDVLENFIRTGSSYILLKKLMNSYENEYFKKIIDTEKELNTTKIELEYLQKQAKNLELLLKRFPNNPSTSVQVVDLKKIPGKNPQELEAEDNGAKYLPITTQIIATNTDINNNNEKMERLAEQKLRLEIIKQVLDESNSFMNSSFDGIELSKKLLQILEKIQQKIPPEDLKAKQQVLIFKASFNELKTKFDQGLYSSISPNVTKKGMLKSPLIGFVLAFFAMFIFLIFKKVLDNLKNKQPTVQA